MQKIDLTESQFRELIGDLASQYADEPDHVLAETGRWEIAFDGFRAGFKACLEMERAKTQDPTVMPCPSNE